MTKKNNELSEQKKEEIKQMMYDFIIGYFMGCVIATIWIEIYILIWGN